MQEKAKEYGKRKSEEKIDPEAFIATAGKQSKKKKSKHA